MAKGDIKASGQGTQKRLKNRKCTTNGKQTEVDVFEGTVRDKLQKMGFTYRKAELELPFTPKCTVEHFIKDVRPISILLCQLLLENFRT